MKNDARWGKSRTRKPLKDILLKQGVLRNNNKMLLFDPKNIKVKFEGDSQSLLKTLIGDNLSHREIGQLVGAIDNSIVEIHMLQILYG